MAVKDGFIIIDHQQEKHYFCNKKANINVQNISFYTCYRQHAMTDMSKTAKT